MRVITRCVIEIETGRILELESYDYHGPWALAKKKKGIGERAEAISAQERAARDLELGKSEPTLSAYERTATEGSPFYQSLLRTKQRGIAGAYRGAKAATRARGAMAGYGYEQPAFQGAEEEVGAREASELGAAPSEAMLEATGPELQVAGMRAGRAGIYSPVPYFSEAAQIEREKQRQRGLLWRSLVSAGTSIATGGVSSWGGGRGGGCWVISAVYGKDSLCTKLLWGWMTNPQTGWETRSKLGKITVWFYMQFGQRVARAVEHNRVLRAGFKRLFDWVLVRRVLAE